MDNIMLIHVIFSFIKESHLPPKSLAYIINMTYGPNLHRIYER